MNHHKFLLLIIVASLAAAESEIDSRIIHGHDAVVGQFPFYVLLKFNHRGKGECGASLISNEWILTAAHCLDESVYQIIAILGTLRAGDENEPGRKAINVNDWHRHPDYDRNRMGKK